ncbi:glycosyltransferase family 2 protein [Anianabacter salinae]|uniref:glycosyltransferase family 2 protein n=1 Tax=Anianabacter salinae TaxID=2851023 RepID=UPI00225E6E51|nr:glycosyltransferase family 2 protein [Anianabacter salinae]MBV0911349.1 glycosyltransferase family 2 protein [Anianabacter salinae]
MKLTIVTTMRNEAPYVLEWVAYHRLIGATDILVYSNDCEDGTDTMLDRLAARGEVIHVRNDEIGKKGIQWSALDRAGSHPAVTGADWLLVSDIDEFVNIKAGEGTFADLVAAVPAAQAIALTWRLFGSSHRIEISDRPVIEDYTLAAPIPCHAPWQASQFKTLFRNDGSYGKLGVHRPKAPRADARDTVVWTNGSGVRMPPDFATVATVTYGALAGYELVQLNHYSVKSAFAFLVKAARGLPNRTQKAIDIGYWSDRNFNTAEDRSILRHLPALLARLADLRTDPALASLHDAGLDWHRTQAAVAFDTLEGLQLVTRCAGTERHDIDQGLAATLLRKRIALRARLQKDNEA